MEGGEGAGVYGGDIEGIMRYIMYSIHSWWS